MGGSSGSSGGGTTKIRYAKYIESHHSAFLDAVKEYREALTDVSPFSDYVDVDVDTAFFGTGYTIASYPALLEQYGTYMSGVDIDELWNTIYEDTVNSSVTNDLISAESALIEDDIEATTIPRLQTGLRDINSIMASSFPVAKAIVDDGKVKALAKFDAELRYKLIPVAQARWQTTLQWNQQLVNVYAELLKFYFLTKHDVNEDNYSYAAKDALWPFTVLDFERAALGALQGAVNEKKDVAGASTTARVMSGALSGAAMGAMVGSNFNTAATAATETTAATSASSAGSGYGAVIGAVLGAAAAYTY